MNRHVIGRIVLVVVVIAALAAVGGLAYQAGLAQGAAVQLGAAGAEARQLMPGGGHGFAMRAGGFGFGLGLGLVGLFFKGLLFFGLIALVLRFIFRPCWGHGRWGHPGEAGGVPPMFAEWHRRAHGEPPAAGAPPAPETPAA